MHIYIGSGRMVVGLLLVFALGCHEQKAEHPCDSCLDCEECLLDDAGKPYCAAGSHDSRQCIGGDVYWFDSCGEQEDEDRFCPQHSECVNDGPTAASCECVNSWEGDECQICPEHWDPASDCTECEGNWDPASHCLSCVANWDIEKDCEQCLGNWDENTGCTQCAHNWVDEWNDCGTCPGNWDAFNFCAVCENQWVDDGDDCGTCPGNWDATADCDACQTNWIGTDCGTCPGNWDVMLNCAECENHWVDDGDDCGTCPGNWDATADCDVCQTNWIGTDCETCPGNWDPASNCLVCGSHWLDDGDDCGTCPGNWDATADCNACVGNWDAALNCAECENHWVDDGDDCGTCPGNWDATADCNACVGNWDEASNCATCENQWVDDGDDCGTCEIGWGGSDCDTCVRYVDLEVASTGDGMSWETAFDSVQDGIDSAYAAVVVVGGPDVCEVWVSQGVYRIFETSEVDTVELRDGIHLYGGFNGTELDRVERDWNANPTILDGAQSDGSDNRSYHVVTGASNARLDGFTVTNGDADLYDSPEEYGGGLYVDGGDMVVANCVFENNTAGVGGGIACLESTIEVLSSVVKHNLGWIYTGYSTVGWAGGMYMYDAVATVENTIIHDNGSWMTGGIRLSGEDSELYLYNSVVWGNGNGDGIENFGCVWVVNSILRENADSEIDDFNSCAHVSYTFIESGYGTSTNSAANPLLVDPDNGDFHLQASSPCIDYADGSYAPDSDFEGNPRVDVPAHANTGIGDPDYADVGAYEYQP